VEPEKETSSPARSSLSPLVLLGILASYITAIYLSQKSTQVLAQKSIKPVQPKRDTQEDRGNVAEKNSNTTWLTAISQPPPTPATHEYAKNTRKIITELGLRKAGKFLLGFAMLWVVLAYTIIAHNQWKEMQRTADTAKTASETAQRQLEMSERPWLKVSFAIQKPGITFFGWWDATERHAAH
jgi:hypothetical protein